MAMRFGWIVGFLLVVYFISRICLACLCMCFAVSHGLIFVFWVRMCWILMGFRLELDWLVWVSVVGSGGGLMVIGLFLL